MTCLDGKNIINETVFTIFHYALDGLLSYMKISIQSSLLSPQCGEWVSMTHFLNCMYGYHKFLLSHFKNKVLFSRLNRIKTSTM
jgi:hypothetical protein